MPDGQGFPRVLILCDEPINRIGGGGVTMRSLFRDWPRDRLAQVWAHHRFDIDTEVCPTSFRLGTHSMPGENWIPQGVRRRRGLVRWLRPILRPGTRLHYPPVRSWAKAFAPDVIYSQATPYPMYTWWLPRHLASDLGVPLVNHIMDDWPAVFPADWIRPMRRLMDAYARRQLTLLFGAAARNLAISHQMAEAFTERYGHDFTPFHNAIDLGEWSAPRTEYVARKGAFRVVYLGALTQNMQLMSLVDIADSIAFLSAQGHNISLTVYSSAVYIDYFEQYLSGRAAVSHGGPVARTDLCQRLSEADLLVIPVNFDQSSLLLNQYSMPTKVPEYMASGTPILVYGPPRVPPTAYARQEGWGLVVDRREPVLLQAALLELMQSESLRALLGRRARLLAVKDHDAVVMRCRFREMLCEAAAQVRVPLPDLTLSARDDVN
ncbi:MAG TPA: glycosyltransferase [Anaerolineae bacterium]|nr:glycosyltransferase [Anaerolineae bacterium]